MAIDTKLLQLMKKELEQRQEISRGRLNSCLSLGFPDLLLSDSVFTHELGFPASDRISNTGNLFQSLGYEPTFIDVKKIVGCEEIVDLNFPLPMKYQGRFDLVFDTGTLEHCFNFAQAFQNMLSAARLGGLILSVSPVSMINHGFYNVSPTLYSTALEESGFSIELLMLRTFEGDHSKFFDISRFAHSRFRAPPEAALVCIARKCEEKPFSFPIQQKYKNFL